MTVTVFPLGCLLLVIGWAAGEEGGFGFVEKKKNIYSQLLLHLYYHIHFMCHCTALYICIVIQSMLAS